MEHETYMRAAIDLAISARDDGEVPVGCVVVDSRGEIIGRGRNRRERDKSATAHAEIEAITQACRAKNDWRLTDCTLYVTLEPCPMCAGAIINARIGRVVFAARESASGSCGSVINLFWENYGFRPVVVAGVLEGEYLAILKGFFVSMRSGGARDTRFDVPSVSRRFYIAGAGDWCESAPPRAGDYIVAADGGYTSLTSRGFTSDVLLGDFDSLDPVPDHPNTLRYPSEKDDTDTFLAVKLGLSRGYRTFIINGGLGGRPDHTFANVAALHHIANNGGRGYLAGARVNICVVRGGEIRFTAAASGYVSVFALTYASDVTISGLKYRGDGIALLPDTPLGVSNEFTGERARIAVGNGAIAVMWSGGLYDTVEDL
jgi:thiamine pyrophosphokinase